MKVPFFDIKEQHRYLWDEIRYDFEQIFRSCCFVNGPFVRNFEEDVKNRLNVKYAIGCGSGTDALVLALRACNVLPGDEVITTSFSFFATAEAIASIGAVPVFVDIKPTDYTIDPEKIEAAISDKTKVILPVQIFGACCDMDRIVEIARKHNLKVIEDDAQAFGSLYKGKSAGSLADIGCFSFYPTKNLGGCGDGGMCTTNDDDLAVVLMALREHGAGKNGARAAVVLGEEFAENTTEEEVTDLYDPYKYFNYLIGYNSRLDALQACVLSAKMKHIDSYNARRAEIAKMYMEGLTSEVRLPRYSKDVTPCWHQFAVRTKHKVELCRYLADHDIGSGTFYPVPLHKQKAFSAKNSKNANSDLPVAEEICAETVCLPIYPEMTNEQVVFVVETVNAFYEENGDEKPFIHRTAEVSQEAKIGASTKIWNEAQVREGAEIGKNCIIGKNVYIDEGVYIGSGVKIQNNVNVYHGVTVEDDVFLGPSMTFTNDLTPRAFVDDWKVSETIVKKGASIGANATIRCGVSIGEYSMVGAGSVVTKDVPAHALVVGNPSRQIGWVCKCGSRLDDDLLCHKCGNDYKDSLHG